MDGGVVSQPIATLNEKIQKTFNSIDTDQDGFITLEDITQFMTSVGIPPLPPAIYTTVFAVVDTQSLGKISGPQFKELLVTFIENFYALSRGQTIEQIREAFGKLIPDKSQKETSHQFNIKVGDVSHLNTKLEGKFLINDADEEKHFQHITKGLKYHEQTIGVIYRIQAHEPQIVEEKLKELSEQVKALVTSMFPPSSLYAQVFNAVEFETAHDNERVTIAIKISDECEHLLLLGYLAFFEKYYSKIAFSSHIVAGFKNDLHSLLEDGVDLLKILSEGFNFGVDLKTNCVTGVQAMIHVDAKDMVPGIRYLIAFYKLLLQDGFKFDLAFDSIEFADFFPKEYKPITIQPSIISNVSQGITNMGGTFKSLPVSAVGEIFELLYTNIKANFSYSLTLPNIVGTIHFKTSGVKELLQSFSEKSALSNQQ